MSKYPLIRKIYLYLFALVGLSLISIGSVRLVSLALKTYVFTKADVYYEYPRPKVAPAPESKTDKESGQKLEEPSKEEIEEFQNKQKTAERQREAAESLAFIIVGLPLYLYHWFVIKKDKEETN